MRFYEKNVEGIIFPNRGRVPRPFFSGMCALCGLSLEMHIGQILNHPEHGLFCLLTKGRLETRQSLR